MKRQNNTFKVPWWSEKLAELKGKSITLKRRIRGAAPARRPRVIADYLQAKEEYLNQVSSAKTQSWKEFCSKQDREGVWEGIYRVLGRTAQRNEEAPLNKDGRSLDPQESVEELARVFFPEDDEARENDDHRRTRMEAERANAAGGDDPTDPPFRLEELLYAVASFNPKKAPGGDGFTADICGKVVENNPQEMLALMNKCLELSLFPRIWKEATVVVLRKPGKDDYTNPKSFRPIGLLPVLGKVLEKMIVRRLKWHLVPRMSTRQYGFMPQRSTEDALYDLVNLIRRKLKERKIVTLISLDIEGAFDSAWWPAIRVRLAEEKCPVNVRRLLDSYLTERRVRVRYAGKECVKSTNKGCVQGSIGGPIMWNLLLDPLLKGLTERGDYVQAFADDVVLLFDGDTALDVQRRANPALAYVEDWGVRNKLRFASSKTKAMVLTRKLKYDTPILSMGGVAVGMFREIKLLGLTIDDKLTFNCHVTNACKKAVKISQQLSRAARISWGLSPDVIRTIYVAAIEPVITYAASAWAQESGKVGVVKRLNAVQRGFAQKMTKAYRTVSLNSALVLSGLLPLDLRVQEAAALYEVRRGVPWPDLRGREVERRTPYVQTEHPAEQKRLSFNRMEQQDRPDEASQDVMIYTDGSKLQNEVGAAISIWQGSSESGTRKYKLPFYATVYQAELLAIRGAVKEITKRSERTFGVYSDSMAALQSVINYDSPHPLAVETRQLIKIVRAQDKDLSLFWVKAHAGLEGNERVDSLAKEAALNIKRLPDYDSCPVSFVKRQIRLQTLDRWNGRYQAGMTAGTTKIFFPDAIKAYQIVRKLGIDHVMTQVFTGHGGFSEYLNRFKCKENPSCICEPGVAETVPHVLLECPVTAKERYDIENILDVKLNVTNLSEILFCKNSRNKFITYCKSIVNKVILRNK